MAPLTVAPDLKTLLGQSVEQMRNTERGKLTEQLGDSWSFNVIIFGASALGQSILSGLRRLGIEPVAFADNNSALWNSRIEGLTVVSPEMATRTYSTTARFIVAIWRSAPVISQLRQLGCSFVASFKALFWHYPQQFLPHMRLDSPHRILLARSRVARAASLFKDDVSSKEFTGQIEWLLSYDLLELPSQRESEQYFETGIVFPHRDEIFVDCGAYVGDTLKTFLQYWPTPKAIYALEPDPENLIRLKAWVSELPAILRASVNLQPYAASSHGGKVKFSSAGLGSRVDENGSIQVETALLDELFKEITVTFIKMDIEGAEIDAINGARRIIQRDHPIVAACVYHRQEHLWEIPLLLHSIYPGYRFFLRRYGDEFGDVVCYAVPPHRVNPAALT